MVYVFRLLVWELQGARFNFFFPSEIPTVPFGNWPFRAFLKLFFFLHFLCTCNTTAAFHNLPSYKRKVGGFVGLWLFRECLRQKKPQHNKMTRNIILSYVGGHIRKILSIFSSNFIVQLKYQVLAFVTIILSVHSMKPKTL